jgi:hypothetical protein
MNEQKQEPHEAQQEPREIQFHDIDQPKFGYPEVPLINDIENTTGLEDPLSESELEQIKAIAIKNLERIDAFNEDKNLDEDKYELCPYKFIVVLFVGPTFTAKTELYGFKTLGAFLSIKDANSYIQKNKHKYKNYDIAIIQMYKFVASYPLRNETQEEADKFLNDIISNYKIEKEIAKQSYEFRKSKLKANRNRIIEKEITQEEMNEIKENEAKKKESETKKSVYEEYKEIIKNEEEMTKELTTTKDKEILQNGADAMYGQNYIAITYVGNSGNNKRVAMKIKGIFNTYSEANEFCKKVSKIDNTYDIVISEMYNWILSDPNTESIEQVYTNEKLNEMFEAHKNENKISTNYHVERQNDTQQLTEADLQQILGSDYTAANVLGGIENDVERIINN